MPQYLVTWECDTECVTPLEAAQRMREMMLDPGSEAVVYTVKNMSTKETVSIDLMDY